MDRPQERSRIASLKTELASAKLKIAYLEQLHPKLTRVPEHLDSSIKATGSAKARNPRKSLAIHPATKSTELKAWSIAHVDAILAQHNAFSGLLKLPQEIKNQIFELVCGDSFVEVVQNGQRLMSSSRTIQGDMYERTSHWETRPRTIDLRLLRTCRQLYNEAKEIPYRTNGFNFTEGQSLQRFLKLSGRCASQVRFVTLHFYIFNKKELKAWIAPLRLMPTIIKKLQWIGLSYSLGSGNQSCKYLTVWSPYNFCLGIKSKSKDLHENFWRAIVGLKRLSLKKARLTFDQYSCQGRGFWDAHEQQIWTDYVKNDLVKPHKS